MTKTYECMVLLDNREVRQGWEPLKQTVTGMFSKYGANVVSARRWDERRLAYPIRGQSRGTYLLVYYEAEGDANNGIRRDMELSEPVLRHLITVCDAIPAEAHEPEAEFDPMAIPEDDAPEPAAPVAEDKGAEPTEDSDDSDSDKDDTDAGEDDESADSSDGEDSDADAESADDADDSDNEEEKE